MNIYIVFILVVAVHAEEVKYKNCPDTKIYGNTTVVAVDHCPKEPCILHRGGEANINITFVPYVDTNTLGIIMKGKLGGFWLPFPGAPTDGCDMLKCKCPLTKGELYKFSRTISISSHFPSIQVPVSIELQATSDDGKVDVVCVEFPIKLV